MADPKTRTLEAPGAVLRYDIRDPDGESSGPPLMLIGSPMDASGFTSLAGYLGDRTVVTYDPRGTARSERTDGGEATPDQHANDLHRVISALGSGPVDMFASSGGAINALALVARHPHDVRTLVAHEPPAAQLLPDREQALTAVADIAATYRRDGAGPAMGKFIALTSLQGPIPADFAEQRAPNAADFGFPSDDDGTGDDPLLSQNIVTCTHYEPAFDALLAAPTRVIVAVGAESEGQMAYRGGVGVAERLGTEPLVFPGGHGASSAGSTASRAIRGHSRHGCARCSQAACWLPWRPDSLGI